MKDNVIADKSKNYAVRIVKLYKYLAKNHNEWVLSRQICRSGTSIGANVREAYRAQSTADFISKLQIALKEADETLYWLELLYECDYIPEKWYRSFERDNTELIRLLVAIIKTKKANLSERNTSDF